MRLFAALLALVAVVAAQETPWAGTWDTTYGRMALKQAGKKVSGTYSGATIEGAVEGTKFVFRYAEAQVKGQGWFVLAADGRSFEGQWKEDGKEAWGAWKGTRASAGTVFTGVFKTSHGPLRFNSSGGRVRAEYLYDNAPGRLEGSAKGNRLTFVWHEGASTGDGWYELSADKRTFKGAWRMKGTDKWTDWTGERVAPRPGVSWLIVVEARWEKKLSDQEYSFGAMLYSYLRRFPNVQVRHRRFGDAGDLQRAIAPIRFLAEPTVVVLAGHGKDGKLQAGKDQVSAETIGKSFRGASNVTLLHFSACSMMHAGVAETIQKEAGVAIPISGYAVDVDWCASAVLEMLYLDLVLGRGIAPVKAAELVRKELAFSGDKGVVGSPLGANKFRFQPGRPGR